MLKFTVEELETPYGDMQLAVERPQERDKFARVWREIRAAMLADEAVLGRVLNAVGGGYSVGVAGIVCFCPISQMDFLTVPPGLPDLDGLRNHMYPASRADQAQPHACSMSLKRPPKHQGLSSKRSLLLGRGQALLAQCRGCTARPGCVASSNRFLEDAHHLLSTRTGHSKGMHTARGRSSGSESAVPERGVYAARVAGHQGGGAAAVPGDVHERGAAQCGAV